MKSVFALILILLTVNTDSPRAAWYSVKFQSLCDELDRPVTPERSAKYGSLKGFRIRQDTVAVDTIRVSFDFISNCCETHSANAAIVNDTLNLEYYRTSVGTCRCICDYRFTYSITDTTKRWSGIKIKRIANKI